MIFPYNPANFSRTYEPLEKAMCGIVGAVAERDVIAILLEGLKRLEYRGYDSAGVALLNHNNQIERCRVKGKVHELVEALAIRPIAGRTGVAHTRWATHGVPSEINAHPHMSSDELALVHNGIIENHDKLRDMLTAKGYKFDSQTDTEVIAHLFHSKFVEVHDLLKALQQTVAELEGAYALAIIDKSDPNRLLGVRLGSPLVVGLGIGENFLASDSLALLPVTQRFIYLEEGDIVDITRNSVKIYDMAGKLVDRKEHISKINVDVADKGRFNHFMQKEIYEQAEAINATLAGRITSNKVLEAAFGSAAKDIFDKTERVTIIACGTSYHAGLIAKFWLEEYAKIPCQVEVASEYRYRHAVVQPNTLFVTISQSGETADTLAALRLSKQQSYLGSLVICNVPDSSLVRESDCAFMTRAGMEIGVASTKAFTTQLTALLMLAIVLGRRHGLKLSEETELVRQLNALPRYIEQALTTDKAIAELAKLFNNKAHSLFLGRGLQYPVALEGALKLKEISYIHAEAYPAGELKHGPLALVDENMPVIAVAPNNALLEKLKSNLQEVQARGGKLIVFAADSAGIKNNNGEHIILMPEVEEAIAPIVYTIPLQLLAYHVAVIRGTDVDQPRNLAKSVTVE